ncbi:tetratricopeptide repeat protein [Candidatus Omnitrophota bacterium]
MNKKLILVSGLIVTLFFVSIKSGYCLSLDEMFGGKSKEYKEMLEKKEQENQQLIQEKKEAQALLNEIKEQNTALSRDYKKLEMDNKNFLSQIKALLKEKEGLAAAKEAFEKANEQNTSLLDDRDSIQEEAKLLKDSLGKMKLHLTQLIQEKVRLEGLLKAAQSDQEKTVGKKHTTNLKTKVKQLESSLKLLNKEKIDLTKILKQAQKDASILEKKKIKFEDQAETLTNQLDYLEKQYAELKKENRDLEKENRTFPKRFAEIARQNKRLISQAADMHYNSGVFFVKNNEYKQAIKELNKVLDVQPDHAYANYNLGYIYAEYLVDRKKAIEYFKNYLAYSPDAKDADWVRKYIYTWQTWYGKENIK